MLDFGFLEPLDVEVFGEADGVESYGADEAVGFGGVEEEGDGFGHLGVEGGGGLFMMDVTCFEFVLRVRICNRKGKGKE